MPIKPEAVILMLTLFSGCKQLIEVPGNTVGQLTTSNVFADSTSAVSGVTGIYEGYISKESPLSGQLTLYPGLSADEITSGSDYYKEYFNNALLATTTTAPDGSSAPLWDGLYTNTVIYAANASLEGLSGSATLTQSLKDQLIGECEVIRGLAYFNLVNLFGEVPKVTSSNFLINAGLGRSPVESVYTLIISDLTDATVRLKPSYPSAGRARPNKFTAMALLSKVFLYRQRWTDADSLASLIIGSGLYQMETNPGKVFLDGSVESIWQMPGVNDDRVTQEGNIFIPYSPFIIPTFRLSDPLLKAFEPGDVRKSEWVHTVTLNGVEYTYPYKYRNCVTVIARGDESYVVFRLAEQYLIRAEARAQLGDLAGAAQDVNVIRNRAGLADLINPDRGYLLAAIMHERQIELFCEWGNRWYDLRRTGKIDSVLGSEKSGIWPADGHGALYPIPGYQIRLNPALTQNPGY